MTGDIISKLDSTALLDVIIYPPPQQPRKAQNGSWRIQKVYRLEYELKPALRPVVVFYSWRL
jgi:hypothetical protein